MYILALDIGNTSVSAGIFHLETLVAHGKIPRPPSVRSRRWGALLRSVCKEAGIPPGVVLDSVITSVVRGDTPHAGAALRRLTGRRPLIVRGSLFPGMKLAYDDPDSFGPDRACALFAAWKKYGAPVIVVDCGTAITVDALKRTGRHIGGTIAPGPGVMSRSLNRQTAALPTVPVVLPVVPVGTNTADAIRAGVYHAAAGGIREVIRELKGRTGRGTRVIGTGGDAGVLHGRDAPERGARGRPRRNRRTAGTGTNRRPLFDTVDPTLVLEGAARLLLFHRDRK